MESALCANADEIVTSSFTLKIPPFSASVPLSSDCGTANSSVPESVSVSSRVSTPLLPVKFIFLSAGTSKSPCIVKRLPEAISKVDDAIWLIAEANVESFCTETIPSSKARVPPSRVLCSSICSVPLSVNVFSSFKLPPAPFRTIDLLLATLKSSARVKVFAEEIFMRDSPPCVKLCILAS